MSVRSKFTARGPLRLANWIVADPCHRLAACKLERTAVGERTNDFELGLQRKAIAIALWLGEIFAVLGSAAGNGAAAGFAFTVDGLLQW